MYASTNCMLFHASAFTHKFLLKKMYSQVWQSHFIAGSVFSFPCWAAIHTLVSFSVFHHSYSRLASFPGPSITANMVEALVKLLRRMMSGGYLEAWINAPCMDNTAVHRKYHASRHPPDVILHRSFTRPSTALGVEGLGTRLIVACCTSS